MGIVRSADIILDRTLPAVSDESTLVAELQAHSEEAFAYLLQVYQRPIFSLVSMIVERGTDPADVTQDVFLKVFKGIGYFHGDSTLKTWLYRIAVHEASNHRRSWLRRFRREPVSLDEERDGQRGSERVRAHCETPYEALEQNERRQLVQRALASLAQPYRTAVALREIEGLPYEEIAQVLGVSEGTVKSRLARGRELLRRKLSVSLGC